MHPVINVNCVNGGLVNINTTLGKILQLTRLKFNDYSEIFAFVLLIPC